MKDLRACNLDNNESFSAYILRVAMCRESPSSGGLGFYCNVEGKTHGRLESITPVALSSFLDET
jgi:hypothetical protein